VSPQHGSSVPIATTGDATKTDGARAGDRKIVFLVRSLNVGGAERQLVALASGLRRENWRVKVFTFYGGGELEAELIEQGIPVRTMNKSGRWDLLGFAGRLLRALRRERPDVVHSYLVAPNIVSALLKPLLRGARIVWGVRASDMVFRRYGVVASAAFVASCWLSRFADLIICNSTSGMQFHQARGYPPTRMIVVENGIDLARFAPDPAARRALRTEWGVPEDAILVGLVARLDPIKDHPTFIRAAGQVARDDPSVRFVCIGGGPGQYRDTLARLADDVGLAQRLDWAGQVADVAPAYSALDVAVSSSTGEGFPNVVLEAMACGVQCVVTDVGDSAFIVGDTGWVCRPSDPQDLARAIRSAVASNRALEGRGARARDRVTNQFSDERLITTTAGHLARLVADH
jgi:glycosyltransferase involved in cell wall biosynthesis